ncbi:MULTISPECIES: WGR domain-containing protein [Asticcacaulis]|uniref:WGR domain-containing protein n=1 Tax=Asticcacaulis TaxID=76890 RepID=UPI001AEA77E4|nr:MULTISPECIES: WGR domain-containing protein [Asticcacaulis]MBP2160600.1 putative DNA-binding WGR domain protein [Asticcacaulis solisilvae]MDR6801645.1 putative DNA-binding WGR domain protein [Asticcacaulis sp. BE141]
MAINILHRVDKDRNMARRYELSVQLGLFGDVAVVRHWGRIGATGQTKEYWYPTEGEADVAANRVLRQKQRRGYELLSPGPDALPA